jgi:hypothetical protein
MQTLIKSAQFQFGRMLFGDGTGKLGVINGTDSVWVNVSNIQNFAVGMRVDIVGANSTFQGLMIKDVNYLDECICFDLYDDVPNSAIGMPIVVHGVQANDELTGLGAIFGGNEIYGLDRDEIALRPYIYEDFGEFDEMRVQYAIDTIEANSGHKVNFIICSWDVRRLIQNYYRENGISLKTYKTEEGFTAIDFMGIPMVVDKFCPAGVMYLLTTECFKLCQLCDWQWLESENGKILKQVPGKPIYTATLVKYAELICENLSAQGMLTGIGIE